MTPSLRVGTRPVEISRPDKVLFPEDGITKAEVVEYHRRIAGIMVPHLRDRPLTMERFPDGIAGEGFFQKEAPDHFPAWIRRAEVEKEDGTVTHVVCDDAAALVYLADQACLTPHVWLSRVDRPRHPDRMIFDVDPPEDRAELARFAARAIRTVLEEVGLPSHPMTTGSKGFHVVVSLDRSASFDQVRPFARRVGAVAARRHPRRLTTEQRKARRGDRAYLDHLRNSYAQTAAAPYALRARPGAPVATPLDWEELTGMDPRRYTIRNVFRRLGQKEDPWSGIGRQARSLTDPAERLEELEREAGR